MRYARFWCDLNKLCLRGAYHKRAWKPFHQAALFNTLLGMQELSVAISSIALRCLASVSSACSTRAGGTLPTASAARNTDDIRNTLTVRAEELFQYGLTTQIRADIEALLVRKGR